MTKLQQRDRLASYAGLEIPFFDRGAGEVFLCLHGNPDSAELWLPLMERLGTRARFVAPDLPGFGLSHVPNNYDHDPDGYPAYVEGLLEAAGIQGPVNLVAHDFGGPIGLRWALAHPERLRSAFLSNTILHGDYRWHFWARVWRTPVLGELSMLGMNRALFKRSVRKGSRQLDDAYLDHLYDGMTPQMKHHVLRLYRAADPQRNAEAEQRWLALAERKPVYVIWGEHDPYLDARYAHRFGARHVEILHDCGHWVPAERPDAIATRIEAFLDG